MNKIAVGFLIFLLSFYSIAFPRFSSSINTTFTYNNNLFCLSPNELTEYRFRVNPARYPYSSADDIDFTFVSRINVHFSQFTTMRVGITGHQFLVNQEKSYGVINCQLEQQIGVFGNFLIYGIWLPNYLIRYYREFQKSNYYPCRFGERVIGLGFQRKFGVINVKPGYAFEVYHYVKPFEYYNTKVHRFSGSLDYQIRKNFTVEAGYSFRLAQAQSSLPDISYIEHKLTADISSTPRVFKRFTLNTGYQFCNRKYTTGNPDDRYHYRRVDHTQVVSLQGAYRFNNFDLISGVELEWRDVNSPYEQEIEEVKEYRADRISVGIRIPLKDDSRTAKTPKVKRGIKND